MLKASVKISLLILTCKDPTMLLEAPIPSCLLTVVKKILILNYRVLFAIKL